MFQAQLSAMIVSLPVPDSISTPTNLLDLNEDCLYEIFNTKRVSAVDLSSLARTCTNLKKTATEIFQRSHKICDFTNMTVKDSLMAGRVLNTFGSSIFELRIDGSSYSLCGVIDSIIKNCSCLRSLTIKSYDVPDCQNEINKMELLFEKLEILRIERVRIEGYERSFSDVGIITPNGNSMNIFANCNSLIDLKVTYCNNIERSIFESYFPKLQNLEYCYGGEFSGCSMEEFVFRHTNLKSFSLDTGDADYTFVDILLVIATSCKQLEKLCISSTANPEYYDSETLLRYLEKLEYLTELNIEWVNLNMTAFIKNLQSESLQVLDLQGIRPCSELIPAISQMKTLRVLKLSEIDGLHNLNGLGNMIQLIELFIVEHYKECKFDFFKIVERLVNLKKFKFDVNQFRISKHLYIQLVNAVRNRPVANSRYLQVDCRTTDDYVNLLCPTVAFKTFHDSNEFHFHDFREFS